VVGGEKVRSFLPNPLPPENLRMGQLHKLVDEANFALGRLQGASAILPDTPTFLHLHIRKEAVLSSQIEGTQSTLSDLLLHERQLGRAPEDVAETSSYVRAMDHGIRRVSQGFPVCSRLIREIHGILLSSGRGSTKMPGQFRRSQNWIGGTRPGNAAFVPPPHEKVPDLISDLERFVNDESPELPHLIRAGLAHVQFETIHPFLDGNGRVGRLLITFLLRAWGVLRDPILYLSLHFKEQRNEYYRLLQQARDPGGWEDWLEFFLEGIAETSAQAAESAENIFSLFESDRKKVDALGRTSASVLRVHQHLQRHPFVSIRTVAEESGLTKPTVAKAISNLEKIGVLREITGRSRSRIFAYDKYLEILSKGTEPFSPSGI